MHIAVNGVRLLYRASHFIICEQQMDRFGYTVFGLQALRRLKGGLLAERNLSLPFVFTNAGESLNCRPNLTF